MLQLPVGRACDPRKKFVAQLILRATHLEGVGDGQVDLLGQQGAAGCVEIAADRTALGAYTAIHAEQVSVLTLHCRRSDGDVAHGALHQSQDALQDEGEASQTRGHGCTANALKYLIKCN